MRRHRTWGTRCALLVAVAALACSAGDKAPKASPAQARADSAHKAAGLQGGDLTLGPEARVALDSGNALFRKKAYAQALEQYRAASAHAPNHPAPYIGMNMVAQATGNKALSDSALAAIRERGGASAMSLHPPMDSTHTPRSAPERKGPIS